MRDFAQKWNAIPDWNAPLVQQEHLSVVRVQAPSLTVVSGDCLRGLEMAGLDRPPIGWGTEISDKPAILRLARDRVLIVSDTPPGLEPGWTDGFAVTCADDQYGLFELSGGWVPRLFAMGTALDYRGSSPSCSFLFAGIAAIGYQMRPDSIGLLVESPLAPYLIDWINSAYRREKST